MNIEDLITAADIRKALGASKGSVNHALLFCAIRPATRVGPTRLYTRDAIRQVAEHLGVDVPAESDAEAVPA